MTKVFLFDSFISIQLNDAFCFSMNVDMVIVNIHI